MISEGGRNSSPSPKRWADSPCLWVLAGGAGVWPQLSQRMPHSELGVFREGCKRPEWLEISHSGGSEIQSLAVPQYPATWCPHQHAWRETWLSFDGFELLLMLAPSLNILLQSSLILWATCYSLKRLFFCLSLPKFVIDKPRGDWMFVSPQIRMLNPNAHCEGT